jgi:hypothetical protein
LNPIQGEFHSPDSLQGGDETDIEDDPFLTSDDEPEESNEAKFYYEDIIKTITTQERHIRSEIFGKILE